jgi:uncharacterized protein with PIN domain
MQRRTYIDSGVLLAVIRGGPEIAAKALQILDDPQRVLVVSAAVRLEVMPKAIFEKRPDEQAAFEQFFQQSEEIPWSVEILQKAYDLACEYGLAAFGFHPLGFRGGSRDGRIHHHGKDDQAPFPVQSSEQQAPRPFASRALEKREYLAPITSSRGGDCLLLWKKQGVARRSFLAGCGSFPVPWK